MSGRRTIIRNHQSVSSISRASIAELKQQVLPNSQHKKAQKGKGTPKTTTIAAYTGVFLLVMSLVAIGYRPPQSSGEVANIAESAPVAQQPRQQAPSVDELVATNIAADLAETVHLPVAANVAELSASLAIRSQLAQGNDTVINKPQIVQPTAENREIITYVAKEGDTVKSIADQFSINPQSLKWANDLTSGSVKDGAKLAIPPVDGVIYTVESGDSLAEIADTYNVDAERIVTFNDLEISGLTSGAKIVLPGGVMPQTQRPGYQPAPATPSYSAPAPAPAAPSYFGGFSSASVGNRYAFGNCTYYVYNMRPDIGSFWGNAATWAQAARGSGYVVNQTPAPGAIAQWNAFASSPGMYVGYAGHVAYVESVNPDGTITITEMNNGSLGGYNIVNSRTLDPSQVSNFIH